MKRCLVVLLLCARVFAGSCTNSTVGGYTCVQECHANNFSVTSLNCAFGSNVTNGNTVYIVGQSLANTGTLSFGVGSCPALPSLPLLDTTLTSSAPASTNHAVAKATSTAACTIAFNSTTSGSMQVMAVEISGSNGTVDNGGAAHGLTNIGFQSAGATLNGAAITTSTNNALVLGGFPDGSANSDVFTAGTGFIMLDNVTSFGQAIEGKSQSPAGAITPTMTSSTTSIVTAASVALQPSGGGGPTTQTTVGGSAVLGGKLVL